MKIIAAPAFKNRAGNPYNSLLYSHMQAEVSEFSNRVAPDGSYAILHFHWPERELNTRWNPLIILARLWLKLFIMRRWRARGTKIVWTVHNLKSHEHAHPRLERWFWRRFTAQLDGVIALSGDGLNAARREHPAVVSLPGFVIPHGHYRGAYPDHPGVDARAVLGIDPQAKVFLFFGKIRPYKNVPALIAAFHELPGEELRLYIVGEPSNADNAEEVRRMAAVDSRIRVHFEHVPADFVENYFRAADLVVLPYREIVNSGTALLALSFDRPVVVPLKGAMGELAAAVGDAWVRTYSDQLGAEVLRQSLVWAANTARPREAPLDAFAWSTLAAQTLAAFQQLVAIETGAHRIDRVRPRLPLQKNTMQSIRRDQ
ncbi:MAG TPA: glycosyltransferase [Terracidiphilus sp.]|jgi:glycosyltransferase involved in cell wall biosynthesis